MARSPYQGHELFKHEQEVDVWLSQVVNIRFEDWEDTGEAHE